jgi:plastocyanin
LFLMFMGAGLLIRCGSTTPAGPGNSNNDTVLISIVGMNGANSFSPATANVKVGQLVAWKNNDTTTHRPILSDVFDTKALAPGATSAAFTIAAGSYDYKCTIHPSMTGMIVVTP